MSQTETIQAEESTKNVNNNVQVVPQQKTKKGMRVVCRTK
jgi:hypothetical protein